MNNRRRIYLLDPKKLSPETIAVAFAKTSRSPKSFQEIAQELSDESSSDFHEKWVIGYGHASVAEHAVLHIAVENVSRLAIECLESNRLASYTEKSTRYQKWDPDSYYFPKELANNPSLQAKYQDTCRLLFDTYHQSIPAIKAIVENENLQERKETTNAWNRRIRTEYVDVSRFLLPSSSLANVGITINSRSLEHALCKMLSHPLDEVREIGEQMKEVALQNVPTLIKYANSLPYLETVRKNIEAYLGEKQTQEQSQGHTDLIAFEEEGENRVLAAVLFGYGTLPYTHYLSKVRDMSEAEKKHLTSLFLGNLSRHDHPIRELEHMNFTFEIVLDQGAYFELKRHRIMTQTPQMLASHLGYSIPRKMVQAGLKEKYIQAMEMAQDTYQDLQKWNPHLGSYIVPNGFNRRVLITMNLRSAFHLINLRAAPNAHFSIRRVARQVLDQLKKISPLLSEYIHLEGTETWREIEEIHFVDV